MVAAATHKPGLPDADQTPETVIAVAFVSRTMPCANASSAMDAGGFILRRRLIYRDGRTIPEVIRPCHSQAPTRLLDFLANPTPRAYVSTSPACPSSMRRFVRNAFTIPSDDAMSAKSGLPRRSFSDGDADSRTCTRPLLGKAFAVVAHVGLKATFSTAHLEVKPTTTILNAVRSNYPEP